MDDPALTSAKLNNDLELINIWTKKWLVTINPDKTKSMIFSVKCEKPLHPQLKYDNKAIESASIHKHLGVILSSNLSWRAHVFNIYERASKRLNYFKGLKFRINREALNQLYKALIRPVLEYADVIWDNCSLSECDLIESVQYESARVVTGAMRGTSRSRLLDELAWEDMNTCVPCISLFYIIKL